MQYMHQFGGQDETRNLVSWAYITAIYLSSLSLIANLISKTSAFLRENKETNFNHFQISLFSHIYHF